MTTETQPPKLSTLSPEQRRILCAETRGWIPQQVINNKNGEKWICWDRDGKTTSIKTGTLADPDNDANDVLALVEHAAKEGWRYNLSDYEKGGHHVQFFRPDYSELHEIAEPTPMRALTSAFLLATNKAQL